MRTIKIKLQIDGVDMVTSFTEQEYNLIKEKVGLDPLLLTLNKMWDEINKHDDLKDNPLSRLLCITFGCICSFLFGNFKINHYLCKKITYTPCYK